MASQIFLHTLRIPVPETYMNVNITSTKLYTPLPPSPLYCPKIPQTNSLNLCHDSDNKIVLLYFFLKKLNIITNARGICPNREHLAKKGETLFVHSNLFYGKRVFTKINGFQPVNPYYHELKILTLTPKGGSLMDTEKYQ